MHPPIRFTNRSALLIVGLLLLLSCPVFAARVATLSGEVEAGRGEPPSWQPVVAGEALEPGDRVRTGADGRAEIVLPRATVRMYPNSLLRVPEAADEDTVELEGGASLFDVLKGQGDFEVHTPQVVVSVKGTRFSVSLDGEGAAVAVFRGLVGVRSLAMQAAREVLVREGFVASGAERLDLAVLDLADPWDAFSGDVLPHLPVPDVAPRGASRVELEGARAAALDTARPQAVVHAAERHPEVRERMARVQRQRRAQAERSGDNGRHARGPGESQLDAAADAPPALANALEEHFIETWLNGGSAGGAAPGGALSVTFVSGSGISGSDRVLIEDLSGLSWQLDEGLIKDVLDGSQSLPSSLVTVLSSQGITDPAVFAQQLLILFN